MWFFVKLTCRIDDAIDRVPRVLFSPPPNESSIKSNGKSNSKPQRKRAAALSGAALVFFSADGCGSSATTYHKSAAKAPDRE